MLQNLKAEIKTFTAWVLNPSRTLCLQLRYAFSFSEYSTAIKTENYILLYYGKRKTSKIPLFKQLWLQKSIPKLSSTEAIATL